MEQHIIFHSIFGASAIPMLTDMPNVLYLPCRVLNMRRMTPFNIPLILQVASEFISSDTRGDVRSCAYISVLFRYIFQQLIAEHMSVVVVASLKSSKSNSITAECFSGSANSLQITCLAAEWLLARSANPAQPAFSASQASSVPHEHQ